MILVILFIKKDEVRRLNFSFARPRPSFGLESSLGPPERADYKLGSKVSGIRRSFRGFKSGAVKENSDAPETRRLVLPPASLTHSVPGVLHFSKFLPSGQATLEAKESKISSLASRATVNEVSSQSGTLQYGLLNFFHLIYSFIKFKFKKKNKIKNKIK